MTLQGTEAIGAWRGGEKQGNGGRKEPGRKGQAGDSGWDSAHLGHTQPRRGLPKNCLFTAKLFQFFSQQTQDICPRPSPEQEQRPRHRTHGLGAHPRAFARLCSLFLSWAIPTNPACRARCRQSPPAAFPNVHLLKCSVGPAGWGRWGKFHQYAAALGGSPPLKPNLPCTPGLSSQRAGRLRQEAPWEFKPSRSNSGTRGPVSKTMHT